MLESVSFSCTVTTTLSQEACVAAAPESVAVGGGSAVGVGRGTSSTCPMERFVHKELRLLRTMMAVTEVWNCAAIAPQVSPDWTVNFTGGCSVIVADGSGRGVSVGVGDGAMVAVSVGTAVGLITRLAALRPA